MQPAYTLKRTNWTGSRYSVLDAGGREIYAVRTSGRRSTFTPPGSDTPRFETRVNGFFSMETALVESSVDYAFAYIKPLKSRTADWSVLNVAHMEIAVFQGGTTQNSLTTTIEAAKEMPRGGWAGMKQSYNKWSEMARYRELVVDGKPVVRFQMAKDCKSIAVTVLNQYIKDIDERVVLVLALRCFAIQQSQSGG
ncbi:MAG: hypothetical protein ACAH95_07830 [Fimbriimonas sp.]